MTALFQPQLQARLHRAQARLLSVFSAYAAKQNKEAKQSEPASE